MSASATPHSDLALPGALALTSPAMHLGTARLARAVGVAGDVLLGTAVVLSIPFVILAIGIPVALFVQLLLRLVRLI
jgi:hypothetical protein